MYKRSGTAAAQLRVLVAPTRVCQLVTPALEERCGALGQEGKDNDPVCKGARNPLGHNVVIGDSSTLSVKALRAHSAEMQHGDLAPAAGSHLAWWLIALTSFA